MNHFQIKKVYVLLFVAGTFTTGYSQVSLTIYNQSSAIIDSVVVELKDPVRIGPPEPGLGKTIFIGVHQANFHSFAPFYLSVYSPVLNTRMQWQ